MRSPGSLRQEVTALPRGSWVVVDEVQKLPSLLNEVHDALAAAPRRWRFALAGSSARRLRREDVNLLGGRVVMRRMLPLTLAEAGRGTSVDDWLRFGGLPLVRGERGVAARVDRLEAYVETYSPDALGNRGRLHLVARQAGGRHRGEGKPALAARVRPRPGRAARLGCALGLRRRLSG